MAEQKAIQDIVDKFRPKLTAMVQLDVQTKAHLISNKVVPVEWIDDLQGPRSEQINSLLKIIRVGTIQQYEGFRFALEETNQRGVLELLPKLTEACGQQEQQVSAPSIPCGLPKEKELDELLKRNVLVFQQKLNVGAELIMALDTADVITKDVRETIDSKPTNDKKVYELMMNAIPKRSYKNKLQFLKALLGDQQHILVDIGLSENVIKLLNEMK